MSKELNEANGKIQDLREFFIRECKFGLWREYSGERYINKYFEITHTLNSLTDKRQWLIVFDREKISCQDINISQIYFYFLICSFYFPYLVFFKIKINNKLYEATF